MKAERFSGLYKLTSYRIVSKQTGEPHYPEQGIPRAWNTTDSYAMYFNPIFTDKLRKITSASGEVYIATNDDRGTTLDLFNQKVSTPFRALMNEVGAQEDDQDLWNLAVNKFLVDNQATPVTTTVKIDDRDLSPSYEFVTPDLSTITYHPRQFEFVGQSHQVSRESTLTEQRRPPSPSQALTADIHKS